MQPIKYAQVAWNDIKNSPGWIGKILLLALLQFIPIFGQIVLFGYIFGWARDIAWGVHAPMPAKIFGNEDGKLYSRGFFITIILFVFSLAPLFIVSIASAIAGSGIGLAFYSDNRIPGLFTGAIGSIMGLVSLCLGFAVAIFFDIGAIRTAIYDRISAGFQLKKLWAMFRYDTNGILRIFGMQVLISCIGGIVLAIIASILAALLLGASMPGLIAFGNDPSGLSAAALVGPAFIVMLLTMVLSFASIVLTVFINLMASRAVGYWTRQFNVAQWRGQDEPMPFEVEEARRSAVQAQYAAQTQYAQAQAEYAQVQGQKVAYQHQQAQAQYAQAQAQAEAQAQAQAEAQAQAQAQAQAEAQAQAQPQAQMPAPVQADAQVPVQAQAQATPNPAAQAVADAPTATDLAEQAVDPQQNADS